MLITETFLLACPATTKAFGQIIAERIRSKPALIFLRGDLGTGKTTFAQGIIESLLKDKTKVLSPTFAYLHSYQHQPPIHHFDLYRLENLSALHELGLDEFLCEPKAIRLVEWPERLKGSLVNPDIEIHLTHHQNTRLAIITHT